ncbi:MAG: hypothetical protein HRT73_16150 [Flavobacteriales bacterium]|nr:hypothetical protein [Flavobacteriales bacterium]
MKKLNLVLLLVIINLTVFSQAREGYGNDDSRKIYSIIISKEGKVKHVIKQGAMMISKVNGKVIKGKWYFKAYPDVVVIVGSKGQILGEIALNKELPLRITPPQNQSGMSVGIGIGPVSVSGLGGGMKNFDMKKYHAEIDERPETKEEKIRREYYLKQRKEQQKKAAAKKAKKEAKIAAKKKKKK